MKSVALKKIGSREIELLSFIQVVKYTRRRRVKKMKREIVNEY